MGFASKIVKGVQTGRSGDQRDTVALSVSFQCTQHIGQSRQERSWDWRLKGKVRIEAQKPEELGGCHRGSRYLTRGTK